MDTVWATYCHTSAEEPCKTAEQAELRKIHKYRHLTEFHFIQASRKFWEPPSNLLFNYFSVIGRCEYGKTCSLLVQLFDQAAQAYQEMISSVNISKIEATIQEGRLTWLVYIIGAAVGGRVSFNRYSRISI